MAERVPKKVKPLYDEITAIVDSFCTEHLNEEYAAVSRKLAAKLARKRPTPLASGRLDIWAASIIYAVGRVNFLFDKSQMPHMSPDELCDLLGCSKRTVGNKASTIMKMLRIAQFEPEYTLPSKMDANPYIWMLSVDGYILDVRKAPRDIQEEAYRLGLIPYIPGEKPAE